MHNHIGYNYSGAQNGSSHQPPSSATSRNFHQQSMYVLPNGQNQQHWNTQQNPNFNRSNVHSLLNESNLLQNNMPNTQLAQLQPQSILPPGNLSNGHGNQVFQTFPQQPPPPPIGLSSYSSGQPNMINQYSSAISSSSSSLNNNSSNNSAEKFKETQPSATSSTPVQSQSDSSADSLTGRNNLSVANLLSANSEVKIAQDNGTPSSNGSDLKQDEASKTEKTAENDKVSKQTTKKRNKLSFNCVNCRKRKSKCDRLKPSCTKCLQLGTSCFYDTDTQVGPKRPNKDAMIARLSKQVEYWKNKALKEGNGGPAFHHDHNNENNRLYNHSVALSLDRQGNLSQNHDTLTPPPAGADGVTSLSSSPKGQTGDNTIGNTSSYQPSESDLSTLTINPEHIYIDFKTQAPSFMRSNGVTKHFDIFSDIAAVQKDVFMRVFMSSIMGFSSINNQKQTSEERKQTIAKILESTVYSEFELSDVERASCEHYAQKIVSGKNDEQQGTVNIQYALLSGLTDVKTVFIEDSIPPGDEQSPLLKKSLEMLKNVLPPKTKIMQYKYFFYSKIYSSLVALNIETFEKSLAATLSDDPENPEFYKIDVGTSGIREKMENLVLLCIIMKLSDVALQQILLKNSIMGKVNSPGVQFACSEDHVKRFSKIIDVSIKILTFLNATAWTTENTLCCLMYLWSYLVVSPGEADMFSGKPTDLLANLIVTLACNIGVDVDPLDIVYFQKNKKSPLINYRRILNVSLSTILVIEDLFKGKMYLNTAVHEQVLSVKHQQFLDKMLETRPEMSHLDRKILSLSFKRAQLYALICEFYHNSRKDKIVSLFSVETNMLKINGFLEKNFLLSNLKKPSSNSEEVLTGTNTKISSTLVENTYCIELVFFAKAHTLMVNNSIFISLQNSSKEAKSSKNYFPFYKKYFIVLIHDVCSSFKLLEDFFEGKYTYALNNRESLSMLKSVVILLNRVIFIILALLVRFSFTKQILLKKLSNRLENVFNSKEIQLRIDLITKMSDQTSQLLKRLCIYSTKKLRFSYFQSFKTSMFFDYIKKLTEKNELCNILLRILDKDTQKEKLTPKAVDLLQNTMGFDINHSEDFKEDLELSELLSFVPISLLEEYLNTFVVTEVLETEEDEAMEQSSENTSSIPFDVDEFNIFDYDFLFKGT
ncbi:hypothetical protein ACO0QE_003860 [Hanseniaspora vineae]